MKRLLLPTPKEFDFHINLQFLKRSPNERLHTVEDETVTKLLWVDGQPVLFTIHAGKEKLIVTFINALPSPQGQQQVREFVMEWFDLETNLKPFYALASADPLLKPLVKKFFGYRIIGQPDLFESITWAIIGQQINLSFAYRLKERFVLHFGEKEKWDEKEYYLFPRPSTVVSLRDEDLLALQFSRQKARYILTVAEAFASGSISKEKLRSLPLEEAKEMLMNVKGIGNWTANYALMKTFRYPDAFPLEDAGLHNAIKNLKGMDRKPTLEEVKKIFKKYKGWEAYATLYLWKSL